MQSPTADFYCFLYDAQLMYFLDVLLAAIQNFSVQPHTA